MKKPCCRLRRVTVPPPRGPEDVGDFCDTAVQCCLKSSNDSTVEQNGEVTPHFIAFWWRLESNTNDLLLQRLDCRHVWAVEEPPNQFIVQRIKQLLGVSKCERLDGEALRRDHVP